MAELVASATKREEEVLEVAAKMGAVPQIAAIGVTSYAGGASGHDPVRIAAGVASLGLTPNIHLTCVGQDRRGIANTLATLESLRIHNTFCISDWPKNSPTPPVFDIDSVQLAAAVSELRRKNGTPFHVSLCAVSPFKYQREDCLYQYVKLEKKIAAGANMAITQVGWDAKKFIELKRYLDERGLTTPLIGNVYVLGAKAAERMGTGNPPGVLGVAGAYGRDRARSRGRRQGAGRAARARRRHGRDPQGHRLRRRLHRRHARSQLHRPHHPARRGAGAALEGTAARSAVRARGRFLSLRPAQGAEAVAHVPADGVPHAAATTLPVPWVKQPEDTPARRALKGVFAWLDRHPALSHAFERAEYPVEAGDLWLQELRQLRARQHGVRLPADLSEADARNGPCGGTDHGQCEVIPEQPCIWVKVMERAAASNQIESLKTFIPPPDRALTGTASWLNYYLERDSRPGRPKGGRRVAGNVRRHHLESRGMTTSRRHP